MSTDTESVSKTPQSFRATYPLGKRATVAAAAVVLGVVVAGFWNYEAVDGFGQAAFAEPLVGDTSETAGAYAVLGPAFGVLFAVAAGLAATFTACNVVVFAMVPELACERDGGGVNRSDLFKLLGAFVGGVFVVGIPYGAFVGMLGPEGIEAMNSDAVRLAQAQAVFSFLGIGLLIWGAAEMGFLGRLERQFAPETRAFFGRPSTRAAVMGLFVGAFAVGRPFPVFRDLLTYAATSRQPLYGAVVMLVNDVGMIAGMVLVLYLVVRVFGSRIDAWVQRSPHGPQLMSGFALLAGGAFFVFYWGLAFAFDVGRWGFKLGLWG